jgi:hypothetical protein
MTNIFCRFDWDLFAKFFPGIATIVAAILVYKFTKRNMEHETKERLSRFQKEKVYEAGMNFWSLLAYTGESENPHTILFWEKEEKSSEKIYYVHMGNAREFISKLNEINYEKGYGLFLRRAPRELFYEYRNILYGFLLKERNNPDEKIRIQKNEMAEKLFHLHQEMIVRLMTEMKLENPTL